MTESQGSSDLKERMEVVKELTQLFRFERMVYLVVTSLSVSMILFSAGRLIHKDEASASDLTMLFGSAGMISMSTNRLLRMWDKTLILLDPTIAQYNIRNSNES